MSSAIAFAQNGISIKIKGLFMYFKIYIGI